MTTATYFSDRSGEVTVGVSSVRKNLSTVRMSNYVPDYSETSSVGKRKLLLPDEVLRLPIEQAIVIIRGQKILRVRKMDYTRHSEAAKLMPEKTDCHIPEWRKREAAENERKMNGAAPFDLAYGFEARDDEETEMIGMQEKAANEMVPESDDGMFFKQEVPGDEEMGNIERVEDLFTYD